MRLKELKEIADKTGYPVAEVDGWKQRGERDMVDHKSILCHHTAGPQGSNKPSYDICKDGRDDLPGPLCHFLIGRDATIYVMAAGRANHAGSGESEIHTNDYAVGIEVENDGLGEKWEDWVMDCYARLCKAICDTYGIDIKEVWGHKEHAPDRKSDPTFDMDDFRDLVKKNGNGFLKDKGLDAIPNRSNDGTVNDDADKGDDGDKKKTKPKEDDGGSDFGGKPNEEDLTGMSSYKKRKELMEKIDDSSVKIKDADLEDMSDDEIKSLSTLDDNINSGHKTATDYASSIISLAGIAGMMYSVLLFFAYLFDTTNNFTEGSVVRAMTGGRLDPVDDPEDAGKDDGVTRITMRGAFKYALIGVLFSLFILSGVLFGWAEILITFLIDKFGGSNG